jgi:hypothetical protein
MQQTSKLACLYHNFMIEIAHGGTAAADQAFFVWNRCWIQEYALVVWSYCARSEAELSLYISLNELRLVIP